MTASGTYIVAGLNEVPDWLWFSYGATTEAKSTSTDGSL